MNTATSRAVSVAGSDEDFYLKDDYDMPIYVIQNMRVDDLLFYIGKYRGHDIPAGDAFKFRFGTATPAFHDELDACFTLTKTMPLYELPHEERPDLMVYRKTTMHAGHGS